MAKLEGYSKVAVVNYAGYTDYHFAIYDDGVEYKVGDMVVLSNSSSPARIKEIIDLEEADNRFNKAITAEVIGKVDTSAYEKRIEQRKEKERLRKEMNKRKKAIRDKLDDDYYATYDETYAELLKQYERL